MNEILSNNIINSFVFAPAGTDPADVGFVDMCQAQRFCAQFVRTVGTSALTFEIVANTAEDGNGDAAVIAAKEFDAGQPDAAGDFVFLEIGASDIAQKAAQDEKPYRYVSARLSFATDTDTGVVNYFMSGCRYSGEGMSADTISA